MGGSTTDQRLVNDESTYQAVIEKLLLDNEGKEVCVANAGVSRHSTYGHIRAFQEWFPLLPDLSPKYVLLYVGINDANFAGNYQEIHGEVKKRPIKTFIRNTHLAQKSRPFFQYIKGEREKIDENEERFQYHNFTATQLSDDTIEKVKTHSIKFRKRFTTLLRLVDAMGAEPICVTQPHRYVRIIDGQRKGLPYVRSIYNGLDYDYSIQQINKIMKELCGDTLIDMYSIGLKDEMYYDGMHTTDVGSEFLGRKMYEAMKEKGMLEAF